MAFPNPRRLLGTGALLCALFFSPTGRSDDFSLIQLPVEVDLRGVMDRLEQSVPVQRFQRKWRRYDGIDVRYRIWRGPLQLRTVGERLHLGADVGYWISAQKKLLGPLKVSGSCGLHEPPRAARLHVSSRLYWGRNWRLHADTRIHRNQFANPCQLTRARIDVTPVIDRYLNRQMTAVLREQVDRLASQSMDIRSQAVTIWHAIQMPLRVDEGMWLLLRPVAIHAAPFRADADSLTTAIAVRAQPGVVLGPRPEVTPVSLPELAPGFVAGRPGLDFGVSVDMSLQSLRRRLADAASQRLERLGIRDIDWEEVGLRAEQGNLVLQTPSLSLRMMPALDQDRQRLTLAPVSPTSGAAGSAKVPATSGHDPALLTALLQETLSWSYADRVETVRGLLNDTLNRPIHPNLEMRGRIDRLEPVALHVEADRLRAEVRVTGKLRLLVK